MAKLLEKHVAAIAFICFFVLAIGWLSIYDFQLWLSFKFDRNGVLSSLITVASIFAGFAGTWLTIITSYSDKAVGRRLKGTDRYRDLLGFIKSTVRAYFFVSVIAFLMFFETPVLYISNILFCLLVATIGNAFAGSIRLGRILYEMAEKDVSA